MNLRRNSFLVILLLFNFYCYGEELLQVNDIYVSENTGDLTDSKSIAIMNGAAKALQKLVSSFNVSLDNISNASCLEKFKPEKLLKDYEVISERMTSKSYSAQINFYFSKQDLESLMNICGVKYSSESPGDILLIPLVFDGMDYRIVDDELDASFYNAINNLESQTGILFIKNIISNSMYDITHISIDSIINGSYNDIYHALKYYKCKSALVIILDVECENNIDFKVKLISPNEEYNNSKRYTKQTSESLDIAINKSLQNLIKDVDLVWKRGVSPSKCKNIYNSTVKVELSQPDEWNRISGILNNIDLIKQYKFKSISVNAVELEMRYISTPQELSNRLLENNIAIFKIQDNTIMRLINQ